MSNTRTGLTGLRQTDMLILQKLRDDELEPVCATSEYLKSICDDPIFWYNRITNKLKLSTEIYGQVFPEAYARRTFHGTHQDIDDVKDYYGFKTLKELSAFMDHIPPKGLFNTFQHDYQPDNDIKNAFDIDRDLLPNVINYENLIFHLRREFAKSKNTYRNDRIILVPESYIKEDTPGYNQKYEVLLLTPASLNVLRKVGIKY